jgi:hypothetical protein
MALKTKKNEVIIDNTDLTAISPPSSTKQVRKRVVKSGSEQKDSVKTISNDSIRSENVKSDQNTDTAEFEKKVPDCLKNDLMDDVIDCLEADICKVNETKSLNEKVSQHIKLKNYTNSLIQQIDQMQKYVDQIDESVNRTELNRKLDLVNDDRVTIDNIGDQIDEIDQEVSIIDGEEAINRKIMHYEKIMQKIALCKDFHAKNGMIVKQCV